METHASPLHPMEPFAMLVQKLKSLIIVQYHLQDVTTLVVDFPTKLGWAHLKKVAYNCLNIF